MPQAIAPSVVGQLARESRDPFYRAALRLAEMVLWGLGASDEAPGSDASGFWVDMHGLFQSFVTRSVRKQLQGQGCVISPEPERYLDAGREVRLRPDVVVRRGGAELPIDAKYKEVDGPENPDVYQVLAYCRALGSPAGIIVVPGAREERRIHCQGGETIWTVTLDLRSREAMEKSARALAELALRLMPSFRSATPLGEGASGTAK
jgi:5-methylcytosine-specific restriction enzyme subunit McrC